MSTGNGAALVVTPKQDQLLGILADGECHLFADVLKEMGYDDDEQRTLITHISNVRRTLRLYGQLIVTERMPSGRIGYRRVVQLTPAVAVLADVSSVD